MANHPVQPGAAEARDRADAAGDLFEVAICTRNRPGMLLATLESLERQRDRGFDVKVVDQSDTIDPRVREYVSRSPRIELIEDEGRGLSRARNIAWRASTAEWVVHVDDDVVPPAEWAEQMRAALAASPNADIFSGQVLQRGSSDPDYVAIGTFEVDAPRALSGRWTKPWLVGIGACIAMRREAIERVGGWDERLGTGTDFPAAEEMDMNWRLTRAGAEARVALEPHVFHEQWRSRADLPAHFRGYTVGLCGFAAKHLLTGDVSAGLYLFAARARGILRRVKAGIQGRSWLQLRIAAAEAAGYLEGSWRGLRRRW